MLCIIRDSAALPSNKNSSQFPYQKLSELFLTEIKGFQVRFLDSAFILLVK